MQVVVQAEQNQNQSKNLFTVKKKQKVPKQFLQNLKKDLKKQIPGQKKQNPIIPPPPQFDPKFIPKNSMLLKNEPIKNDFDLATRKQVTSPNENVIVRNYSQEHARPQYIQTKKPMKVLQSYSPQAQNIDKNKQLNFNIEGKHFYKPINKNLSYNVYKKVPKYVQRCKDCGLIIMTSYNNCDLCARIKTNRSKQKINQREIKSLGGSFKPQKIKEQKHLQAPQMHSNQPYYYKEKGYENNFKPYYLKQQPKTYIYQKKINAKDPYRYKPSGKYTSKPIKYYQSINNPSTYYNKDDYATQKVYYGQKNYINPSNYYYNRNEVNKYERRQPFTQQFERRNQIYPFRKDYYRYENKLSPKYNRSFQKIYYK